MKKVKINIDGKEIFANEGETIVEVAEKNNIIIPRLCKNERLEIIGSCRMCLVEVEGARKLQASCSTPIKEGMIIKTRSPRVLKTRRINMELILANHDMNCLTCSLNLNCKLQRYAEELGIQEVKYDGEKRHSELDNSSISIRRDNDKCILCGQCIRICNDIQTVYAINQIGRGFETYVKPPLNLNMKESNCVNCGQCVINCPTGALSENSDIPEFMKALKSGKYMVVQTAPSIRAALGEMFGMEPGTLVTGKMISALKEIGFKKVFNTNLGADITIIEEATELVKRLKSGKNLPMITTCCPAWIKFGEQFYFEQLNHMSTCKSPQAMTSSLIKTYFARKEGIKPSDIIVVDIMPCTAKKYEITREELKHDTDLVLTTVELSRIIKLFNIDFVNLKNSEFDNPLGESSGAGDIFGRTGGVMEAALRTAADFLSGKKLESIDYEQVRGMKTLKTAEIGIGNKKIRIAAVHTLGEARKLMEEIRLGKSPYHFIEIMACYGGCIGGGGQPRYESIKVLEKRTKALAKSDNSKKIRKSHENPEVKKLYKEYIGEPGGKRAHKLLHTKYFEKDYL